MFNVIPFFERGDHVNSNMQSNINFDISKITKNRPKPSIYQKLPKMTFRWPLRQKLTFFRQTNNFFWFLDPKNPLKHVLFMNLFFFVFFIILTILHIFSTLWAKNAPTYSWWQLDMNFVPYDLPKKHLKHNYPGGGSASWLLDYCHFDIKIS